MPKLRCALGYLLAIAILLSLGSLLLSTWGDLAATNFRFEINLPPLFISLLLLVLARGLAVEAWRRILISLGEQFEFGFAARVWFFSNLTRYIPGNIWQVATMMVMVEEKGVSKTNALISQVIYTAISLSIAGLFGLGFVFVQPQFLSGVANVPQRLNVQYAPLLGTAAFVALIAIFSAPHSYRFIVTIAARITRRDLIASDHTFARGIVPPLLSSAMWLTQGLAFYLFVNSLAPIAPEQLWAFVTMNAAAYWVGYVSFITPSGLGFREAALALMLGIYFPVPVAVAVSLAARLWTTAGELLSFALVWSVPHSRRSDERTL